MQMLMPESLPMPLEVGAPLIAGRQIAANTCRHLMDDQVLPDNGLISITLARWEREAAALTTSLCQVGVRVASTVDIETCAMQLLDRPLIVLEFPSFGDGRAFTQARVLRERYGYRGELRASGDVRRDQLFYMQRCGFDTFELAPHVDLVDALRAFTEIRLTYQGAADSTRTIQHRRSAAT